MLFQWYVSDKGVKVRLRSETELLEALRCGAVTSESWVRTPENTAWVRAGSLAGFGHLLQAAIRPEPPPRATKRVRPPRRDPKRHPWKSRVFVVILIVVIWSLFTKSKDPDVGKGAEPAASPVSTAQIRGPYGEWLQSYVRRMTALSDDVAKADETAGTETMLAAETLASAARMAEAEQRARAYDKSSAAFEARLLKLIADAPAEIEALDLPADVRQKIISGYQSRSAVVVPEIKAVYATDHQEIAATIDMLQFMQQELAHGHYAVLDGQIFFTNQDGDRSYESRTRSMEELYARAEQEYSRMVESLNQQTVELYSLGP